VCVRTCAMCKGVWVRMHEHVWCVHAVVLPVLCIHV
jgi:hypothetical protein